MFCGLGLGQADFPASDTAMQAIDWFGPKPLRVGATLPLQALAGYGVAIALGLWVGASRERCLAPTASPI